MASNKKPPLGSGPRFHNLVSQLSGQKAATDPKALHAAMSAAKSSRAKRGRRGGY